MILSILLYVLGFATAGFAAIVLAPMVARRAQRLARRRFEASLPTTLKDVQADRDELRAELAVSQRRTELEMESIRDRDSALRIEIGERAQRIDQLNVTISERDDEIIELKDVSAKQREQIGELETDLTETTESLEAEQANVAQLNEVVSQKDGRIVELEGESNAQRVEIAALKTQTETQASIIVERDQNIERLNDNVQTERDTNRRATEKIARLEHDLTSRSDSLHAASEQITRMRTDHSSVVEKLKSDLSTRIAEVRELQQRVTMQAAESVRQTKRSQTLESRLHDSADAIARLESQVKATQRAPVEPAPLVNDAALPDTKASLRTELKRQMALITARDQLISDLQDQLRAARDTSAETSTAYREAKSKGERVSAEAKSSSQAETAASADIRTLTEALAQKTRLVKEGQEKLNSERREKQRVIDDLRTQNRSQKRRIETLERQLSVSAPAAGSDISAAPTANGTPAPRPAAQSAEIASLKRSLAAMRPNTQNGAERSKASAVEKLRAELQPASARVVHLSSMGPKTNGEKAADGKAQTSLSPDDVATRVSDLAKTLATLARPDQEQPTTDQSPTVDLGQLDSTGTDGAPAKAAGSSVSAPNGTLLDRIKGLREHA